MQKKVARGVAQRATGSLYGFTDTLFISGGAVALYGFSDNLVIAGGALAPVLGGREDEQRISRSRECYY